MLVLPDRPLFVPYSSFILPLFVPSGRRFLYFSLISPYGVIFNHSCCFASPLQSASVLQIGVVEEAGKHRTRKKSLQAMRDMIGDPDQIEHLAIMHGMAPDIDVMTDLVSGIDHRLGHIGAVIGTHGGPRVIGACWLEKR